MDVDSAELRIICIQPPSNGPWLRAIAMYNTASVSVTFEHVEGRSAQCLMLGRCFASCGSITTRVWQQDGITRKISVSAAGRHAQAGLLLNQPLRRAYVVASWPCHLESIALELDELFQDFCHTQRWMSHRTCSVIIWLGLIGNELVVILGHGHVGRKDGVG